MINVAQIKLNELIYYTPSFSNSMKVAIIKLISDDVALVQPRPKKDKEAKPFCVPVEHIYYKPDDANRGAQSLGKLHTEKEDRQQGWKEAKSLGSYQIGYTAIPATIPSKSVRSFAIHLWIL